MAELGLATTPGDTALADLQRRIASAESTAEEAAQHTARTSARHASRAATQPRSGATYRELSDREMQTRTSGETVDAKEAAAMNRQMRQIPGLQAKLRRELGAAYRKLPDVPRFHTEMARAGRWPAQCDVAACTETVS